MNKADAIIGREPVPRQPALVRVVFREHDPLEIPIANWVEHGLKVGLTVEYELFQILKTQADLAHVKALLSRYLSTKPRTEQEVDSYLRKRDISENLRSEVIRDLRSSGVLNDELYSTMYVESKGKRHSHKEIIWRLKEKGVKPEVVQNLLLSEEALQEERNTALLIGRKYWMRNDDLSVRERRLKLANYLGRKGFPMHVIRRVVDELQNGVSNDLS